MSVTDFVTVAVSTAAVLGAAAGVLEVARRLVDAGARVDTERRAAQAAQERAAAAEQAREIDRRLFEERLAAREQEIDRLRAELAQEKSRRWSGPRGTQSAR